MFINIEMDMCWLRSCLDHLLKKYDLNARRF